MLDQGRQDVVMNAICGAASRCEQAIKEALTPSVLYRPGISRDGNQWCALYGANLQEGVAGFGDSPELAMLAFDKAWCDRIDFRPARS